MRRRLSSLGRVSDGVVPLVPVPVPLLAMHHPAGSVIVHPICEMHYVALLALRTHEAIRCYAACLGIMAIWRSASDGYTCQPHCMAAHGRINASQLETTGLGSRHGSRTWTARFGFHGGCTINSGCSSYFRGPPSACALEMLYAYISRIHENALLASASYFILQ